jgi:hypothetical protein
VERLEVECLSCGDHRVVVPEEGRRLDAGDCPRCGYVGWAPTASLTERTRRLLRELPLFDRHLKPA